MAIRPDIPKRIQKVVFQQFGSRCAFCGETEVSTLEIHHIEPYAEVKAHEEENLILVCGNCHSRINAGEILKAAVYRKKVEASSGRLRHAAAPANVISLENSSNTGVIANQLTITAKGRSKVKVAAPLGTIASNYDQRNYIKELIDRYHEFKRAEVGSAKMNYAIFYGAIKRKFGAKWDYISSNRFEEVACFIQCRIDRTILGKTQKSRGVNNYSTFDEYMAKHGA